MIDYLTFHRFIARDLLLVFYYLGAVGVPLAMIVFKGWCRRTLSICDIFFNILEKVHRQTTWRRRVIAWGAFSLLFLLMELCWRMMFEVMIGYFDMHDTLYEIYKTGIRK